MLANWVLQSVRLLCGTPCIDFPGAAGATVFLPLAYVFLNPLALCMSCHCCWWCVVSQGGFGFRRRLAQQSVILDNKVAMWVLVKFTGTTEPVVTTVTLIDNDPCKIPGFCNTIEIVDVLHVTAGVVNTTDLELSLTSYTPGSLRFKTAWLENNITTANVAFLLRTNRVTTNRGALGNCTSTVELNTRLWNCVVFIPAGDTIQLSVTVPNTLDPAKPITKTLDVLAPGKLL